MVYAVIVAVFVFGMACGLIVNGLRSDRILKAALREHARERQLLINQILHQAGATWQPPPAAEPEPPPEPTGEPMLTVSPDQQPDY